MTDSKNGASETMTDVRQEVQNLRKDMEVQAATQAGAHATQAATQAGPGRQCLPGSMGLIVGLFLALAFAATPPSSTTRS